MIGQQVLGYRVDEVIGSGSFGTVYKVSKTNASGTYVRALKHIKLPSTKQQYNSVLNSMGGDYSKADDYFAAALQETVDEIRILSTLSESGVMNIVRYYENDIIETSHPKTYNIFMMMEYLTPFPEIIETRTMSVGEVIRVGKDILKALISCHQKNIIHRDIKDDNIFVTADGVYKLGDFGVSKKLQDKSRAASMRGTPNFIAPEVYLGKESYDCTVDLYSLGIVLYRLLNKLRGPFLPVFPNPYTSDDENAAFEARIAGQIPTLPLMAQNSLGEAVRKAIMPRAQRYNSAQEFLDALEKAESELSREAWLTPVYELFSSDDDADESAPQINTSIPDGNKTVGGLRFDTDEDSPIRVGKNLFMTIGADQTDTTTKQDTSDTVAAAVSSAEKEQDASATSTESKQDTTTVNADNKSDESVAGQVIIQNTDRDKDVTVHKTDNEKTGKPGKPKTAIILSACAALVVILCIILWSTLGSHLTIAGKKTDRDVSSIWLENVTVTTQDMDAMAKLKDLKYIYMDGCVLSDDVTSRLANLSSPIWSLDMSNCTGVTDYSAIGQLQDLHTLILDNMQLTDDQLADMFTTVPEYLSVIDLSNNPALTDLSGLSSVISMEELCVSNTSVLDFSTLQNCTELYHLTAQNCGISVLNSLSGLTSVGMLDLGNNQIFDITGISSLSSLEYLYLNHNQISNLDELQQLSDLVLLDVSNNSISSLSPLAGHVNLEQLYVNRNSLTNLDGLEQSISLQVLEAANNQISNIDGIANCTVLEEVHLSSNQIEDISILGKSAGTLEALYFHHNLVSDISALSESAKLKYLGFDYNRVTDLDAIPQSDSLEVLSAAHNEIRYISGLGNAPKLRYIYLNNNRIMDMLPIVYNESGGIEVLDLSNNEIVELLLPLGQECSSLVIYNNPITDFYGITNATGRTVYLSYVEDGKYSGTNPDFSISDYYNYVVMTGCPLDQQYHMNEDILGVDYLSPYLEFVDADELYERLNADKSAEALGTN